MLSNQRRPRSECVKWFVLILLLCLSFNYVRVVIEKSSVWGLPNAIRRIAAELNKTKTELLESESGKNLVFCENWINLAEDYRRCFLDKINKTKKQVWSQIKETWELECDANRLKKVLGVQMLTNWDDSKGYIDFQTLDKNTVLRPCNLVTLGVGGDVSAEEKLLKLVPNCKLYGADPENSSGHVYTKVGKYFQFAVSSTTGVQSADVRGENGTYYESNVTTVEFLDFLKNHAKISMIDHLWMDAEGAEYKLLNYLHRNGTLAKNDITVCQLSVEIHGHPPTYGVQYPEEWERIMRSFFKDSDFIVLWSLASRHVRLYAVNYKDRSCIIKYYSHIC